MGVYMREPCHSGREQSAKYPIAFHHAAHSKVLEGFRPGCLMYPQSAADTKRYLLYFTVT